MGSVEVYKSAMPKGLKTFFETYENSIKELINNLDSDGLLLKKFNKEQVTRLINLAKSCNMALKLSNDFYSVIDLDEVKRKARSMLRCGEGRGVAGIRGWQDPQIVLPHCNLAVAPGLLKEKVRKVKQKRRC